MQGSGLVHKSALWKCRVLTATQRTALMQGSGLVHKSAVWKCRVSTATQWTALFQSVVFQLLCKGAVLCTSRHFESVVFQLLRNGLLCFKVRVSTAMQGSGLVHKSALWKCRVSTATQRTALFESVMFQLLCKGLLRLVLCTSRHSESVVLQLLRKGLLCLKASCFNCYARGFSVWSCAQGGTLKVSCFKCYAKDCFVWKRRVSIAMQGSGLVHKSALWKCRVLTATQRTALFESVMFQLLCKGLLRLVLCTSRHSESVVF